jgi:prepilin-type N-terminal cleavage/methylation domain-containing protein
MKQKNSRGFTLIELLVVIAIIGILSSMGIVSLNSARVKARDALRKADMTQLRTAMMIYFDDNNRYPVCGTWNDGAADFGAGATTVSADCYKTTLGAALTGGAKPYISPMPKDPLNLMTSNQTYFYRYVGKSDGSEYALVYMLEGSNDIQVIRGW